jgi:omega-amidase
MIGLLFDDGVIPMSTSRLKVALLQMDITIGHPDANFARAEKLMNEAMAVSEKPDVLVLPEMWNTGYALERIRELSDREGERTRAFISEFCRKHHVHVIAGSVADLEGRDGQVRNTTYSFNRQGELICSYSKIHLFRLMDEEKYLASGDQLGLLSIEGIEAGSLICYDIRFPELTRKMALAGAKVLFVPAEWPKPRLNHWRTLLIARAIENQMYVVACNRVGISGTTEFFGHSLVIDPWGEVIAEAGEEEGILRATLDLSQVEKVRGTIPVFADRRPELY